MMNEYATAADFTRWEEQAKSMSDSALFYTMQDCFRAAKAMSNGNPVKEGFYMDQGCTYAQELRARGRHEGI